MSGQRSMQAVVVPGKADPNQGLMRLALFNEDGSPLILGGLSETEKMAYSGGSHAVLASDPGDVDTILTFGNAYLDYVTGFGVETGDEVFDGPAGPYFVKLAPNFGFEDNPTAGWLTISLTTSYMDANDNPVSGELVGVEVHWDHDTTGYGDFGFTDAQMVKTDVGIVPVDSQFGLLISQHGLTEEISVNLNLILVKL